MANGFGIVEALGHVKLIGFAHLMHLSMVAERLRPAGI
jgi:hypothetical protein